MRSISKRHNALHSESFSGLNTSEGVKNLIGVSAVEKKHLMSAIYNSAMVIVLAVCCMIAAGISKQLSIEIGMAAEAVMLMALLFLSLTKNIFITDNRS
jgi:Na+-translocating ferredoxin:NAD+ oxidoreductase RnfE subunit